jgi:hypothetical protein
MAANKVTATGLTQYHIIDSHNNRLILAQAPGSASVTIGGLGGATVVLTKQNVTDLLPGLTNFSNNGLLT